MKCSCGDDIHHTATKANATLWSTLPLVGVQVLPAWQDEPEQRFELRNAPCMSTLAVEVQS